MKIRITLKGTSPLLMHNQRLSDPLDSYARQLRAISGKKKKTDEDYEEMARIEFEGGLYIAPEIGPYVPGVNVHRSLVEGARITKRGKDIERGLVVHDDICPLAYKGPRDVAGLCADKEHMSRLSVRVGTSRVMRTRPMFREWALECEAVIDPGVLNFEDVCVIAETAGSMAGLGDYRPSSPHGGPHGRYEAVVDRS